MLELVHVGPRALAACRDIAPDAILDALVRSVDDLRGARVLHVNATDSIFCSEACRQQHDPQRFVTPAAASGIGGSAGQPRPESSRG